MEGEQSVEEEETVEEELTRGMTPEFYIAQIKRKVHQHMTRFKEVELINIGRHIEELCEEYASEFFANFTEFKEVGYEGLEDVDAFKGIYLDIESLGEKLNSLFIVSDLRTDLSARLTHEEICWGFVQVEIEKAQRELTLENVVAAFEYILQAQKGIMLADQLTRSDPMENELEYQRKKRKKSRRSQIEKSKRAESSKEDKEKLFELYDEESVNNPATTRAKKIDNIHGIYVAYLEEKSAGELPEEKDHYDTMNKWIRTREREQATKRERQDQLELEVIKDQENV